MSKLTLCPICNQKTQRYYTLNLNLLQCDNCHLIFQLSSYKLKEIENGYKKTSYFSFWGNKNILNKIHEMKKATAQILMSQVNKFVSVRSSRRLLDVGCASGALLEVAKSYGYSIYGIELNKKYAQIAKTNTKAEIYIGPFENNKFASNFFDAIVFFDSLEHMRDLNLVVKKAYQLLRPNGVLVISTPDTESLSFKLLGKSWPHFKMEHLYYFNNNALTILLTNNGFGVLLKQSSLKTFTLGYIKSYFEVYKTPVLSIIIRLVLSLIPSNILYLPLIIHNGNMLLIAKKI